jgi:hypothetical protein
MEKKYKAIIYIIACLSGLTLGTAIASSAFFNSLISSWFGPSIQPFHFTTEQLTITSYAWGTSNAYINMTVKNTSSLNSSIVQIQVNSQSVTPKAPALPYALAQGQQVIIKVISTFDSGTQYSFAIVTAKGNQFEGSPVTAP